VAGRPVHLPKQKQGLVSPWTYRTGGLTQHPNHFVPGFLQQKQGVLRSELTRHYSGYDKKACIHRVICIHDEVECSPLMPSLQQVKAFYAKLLEEFLRNLFLVVSTENYWANSVEVHIASSYS
jgi:hypothetical protein